MDFAKCTLDNKIYRAHSFEQLPTNEIDLKRKHLICKECDAKAYFKKRSKSGQSACFGARPHNDTCSLKTEESQTSIGKLQDDERELINKGSEINVIFDVYSRPVTHISQDNDHNNTNNSVGSCHSLKNGVGSAKSKRNLRSLLNMLLHCQDFAQSNQKINIGKYSYNAKTIFKQFSELSDKDIGMFRGVYGQIFDVGANNNIWWINSGGQNDCSIKIDSNLHNNFWLVFEKYSDLEELNGAYVLCFGWIEKSKKNKYYIQLDDLSKIIFI